MLRLYLEEEMACVMEWQTVDWELDWNEVLMMAFHLTEMCCYQNPGKGLSDLDLHCPCCSCDSSPSIYGRTYLTYRQLRMDRNVFFIQTIRGSKINKLHSIKAVNDLLSKILVWKRVDFVVCPWMQH